jgi:hypothetical protein
VPVSAIGEHPDVPLSGLVASCPDVAVKLRLSFLQDAALSQIALYLEHAQAHLYIDPSTLACRLLQHDVLQMILFELERRRQ